MNNHIVLKSKNIDINNINICKNNNGNEIGNEICNVSNHALTYNNDYFMIQTPIIYDYELLNYNSKHYIELKLNMSKPTHVQFLTFIDSLELKLNNYNIKHNIKPIKTQIITNIQNNKSIKVKLLNNIVYYNLNKVEINELMNNKISLLFKIEYNFNYYSLCAVQILQLN